MTGERLTQTSTGGWTSHQIAPTPPPLGPPLAGDHESLPPTAPAGPPSPAGTAGSGPPPPHAAISPSWRRRGWRVAVATLVALGLVGGGVTIGSALADDVPAPSARSGGALPDSVVPGAADQPVGSPDAEPIVGVARTLGPAVVLVTTSGGSGSGIVYDDSGLIVTNAHVVGSAASVGVTLHDGTRVEGSVVGADSVHDVAVVRVNVSGLPAPAIFAASSSVEVGETAIAIGSPFGLTQTVTAGIVSAVGRLFPAASSPTATRVVEMIQTDAPINPGSSGGALANLDGEVIGMNTSIRTDGTSGGNVGVGFAIPSDSVRIIADRLVDGDASTFGVLGVSLDDGPDGGALVTEVIEGSGAEDAGVEVGDVIMSIDGKLVSGRVDMVARIQLFGPGTALSLGVERSGVTLNLDAVLTQG